jgi:hypothetical protein
MEIFITLYIIKVQCVILLSEKIDDQVKSYRRSPSLT